MECYVLIGRHPRQRRHHLDIAHDKKIARVFVFDTDEGGNGGFAALMRNGTTFINTLKPYLTFLNVHQLERQGADIQSKVEQLEQVNQSMRS
jgi:hypothetical protein